MCLLAFTVLLTAKMKLVLKIKGSWFTFECITVECLSLHECSRCIELENEIVYLLLKVALRVLLMITADTFPYYQGFNYFASCMLLLIILTQ